jgi:hypothetical protein
MGWQETSTSSGTPLDLTGALHKDTILYDAESGLLRAGVPGEALLGETGHVLELEDGTIAMGENPRQTPYNV